LEYMFSCSLRVVFGRFGVWTILMSAFYRPFAGGISFLMLLLELYMGLTFFPAKERELGSCVFAVWALVANVAANLVFLGLMVALSVFDWRQFYTVSNTGLWPLLMVLLSFRALSDPESSTSLWGVVLIPNKWYPFALVALFSLMNGIVMWNLFAAISVGYMAYAYPRFHIDRLLPSPTLLDSSERRCCISKRDFLGGAWLSSSTNYRGVEVSSSRNAGPSASVVGHSFTVFSGAGNRLGSEDDPENKSSKATGPLVQPGSATCLPGDPESESEVESGPGMQVV